MRIGIVAGLTEGQKTGIGVYTGTLIDALKEIDTKNEYIPLTRKNTFYPALFDAHQYGYYVWQMGVLPLDLRRHKLDLIHDPFGNLACFGVLNVPCKKVITLHDIAPLLNKGNFSKLMGAVHGYVTPRAIARADAIITDSVFSKLEIMEHCEVDPDKIRVVYPAVSPRYYPWRKTLWANKLPKEVPDDYILYVGSVHKQKNIQALFRAYALIKSEINCKIVVVGRKYYDGGESLPALMEELNITKDVIFTGYVPDDVLPALYSAARVFVFPSLYEGFGLPPLEAMACGCPVVCSNRASLPEAVGYAAVQVDPDDTLELARWIRNLIKDEVMRKMCIRFGFKWVKQFTPENTARETLKVYEEVLKS